MKRYRVVFNRMGSLVNSPFFVIEYSTDGGIHWDRLDNVLYDAKNAHKIVQEIIEGEGEYVLQRVCVEKFVSRSR